MIDSLATANSTPNFISDTVQSVGMLGTLGMITAVVLSIPLMWYSVLCVIDWINMYRFNRRKI